MRLHRAKRIGLWICRGFVGLFGLLALLLLLWRFFPPVSTLMLARFATNQGVAREWRPLEQISPHLALAVITSEDAKFCSHAGVDWDALQEEMNSAASGKTARGASTIPMQVSKNLFLWPARSIIRKGVEIPLALSIDALWPKHRLLEVYLNIAEWGPGIFGAEAASNHYFHKSADKLTLTEAALLATALPNPAARHPDKPSGLHMRMAKNLIIRIRSFPQGTSCLHL